MSYDFLIFFTRKTCQFKKYCLPLSPKTSEDLLNRINQTDKKWFQDSDTEELSGFSFLLSALVTQNIH